MLRRTLVAFAGLCLCPLALQAQTHGAGHVSSPKEVLGFNIGDDYQLANYTQLVTLWKRWAGESNRMKLEEIGKTAEGRTMYMVTISSPENLKHLDRYKEISRKLSLAEGLTDDQAHALAAEGKAVVWIDGGLHAAETEGSQQLIETVYHLLSSNDPEALRLLNDDIVLAVLVNPDGQDIMADWYMRQTDTSKRTFIGVPTMYHHYAGHDNNRDFIMDNLPESEAIANQLYRQWYPQIVYNHHQLGPTGAIVFVPPFRDPFNYVFDPQISLEVEAVGTAMNQRLVERGMGGSAQRAGANYSTWWNGGLRTAPYFHNQIGLLTEIIGAPTPIPVEFSPSKQLPNGDWPLPIPPGMWHFRQSIDYDLQLNRAVLDYASRNRDTLLYDIYRMGKSSIARGSEDSWTISPKAIERAVAASRKADPKLKATSVAETLGAMGDPTTIPGSFYTTVLHDPARRDPRGYILSADQPDFPTAIRFLNALIKNGVTVQKATAAFTVDGKTYPEGSYVVLSAQAFRPEILDFFEPQNYPNDFAYPGGPPKPPYDMTGWTLAMQMGVQYDRVLNGFTGPFTPVKDLLAFPAAKVEAVARPAGYLISHQSNNSTILENRLLKAGLPLSWMEQEEHVAGKSLGTGAIWVPASDAAKAIVEKAADELGIEAHGLEEKPAGAMLKIKPVRVGLVDVYGGMIPAGWTRWLLEHYEFPYKVVYPQQLDAGSLKDQFDVLVFPSSVYGLDGRYSSIPMPPVGYAISGTGIVHSEPAAADVPDAYKATTGFITADKTIPMLNQFVAAGGTVVAEGTSAALGAALGLPVSDHLTEMGADGKLHHLPGEKFYIPGSLLKLNIDNTSPLAYGMPKQVALYYDNNPVFNLAPDAQHSHTTAIGWFSGTDLELSGWAWGQQYLDGGSPFVTSKIGAGRVTLLGTDVTFRAQPAATFKLLFNSLLLSSAEEAKP
ncbi:Zinc carboxypeptidase [Bryocella elongata]|uniref:Zinc carboxypeptidase n=1 Tax=Bryocella elongata TaxID=863522 RepID=A0A1H6AVT5_9BACT|nr:M14 metallopeptidase family protein [Bryocella elongata]SEG52165.1 Zinc carboxypeptidase [Bryocella elongata]